LSVLPADWEYHRFTKEGRHLVLDVNSSSARFVSEAAYHLLPLATRHDDPGPHLGRRFPPRAIRAGLDELEAMKTDGFVTERDDSIPRRIRSSPPRLKLLFLNLVHECNLRCRYCFAGEGQYRGPQERMSRDVVRRSVDLLLSDSDPDDEGVLIRFFGGEPLLDFPLLRWATEYAAARGEDRGKKVGFSIFTNGTLVTPEIASFFREHDFEVLVSLDGPPETNDRMRVTADGRGSYGRTLAGIRTLQRILGARRVGCRIVLTPSNLDLVGIVNHMQGLGMWKLMLGPVWETGAEEYSFAPRDVDRLKEGFTELARAYLRSVLNREVHFLGISPIGGFAFRQLEGMNKDVYYCLAGRKSMVVTPSGELYPCFHFIGRRSFHMGDVRAGIDERVRRRFSENFTDNRPVCSECWARYLCGGGCPADSLAMHGDIDLPNTTRCEIHRHVLELSLYVYATIEERDPKVLEMLRVIGTVRDGYYSDKGFVEHLETFDRTRGERARAGDGGTS